MCCSGTLHAPAVRVAVRVHFAVASLISVILDALLGGRGTSSQASFQGCRLPEACTRDKAHPPPARARGTCSARATDGTLPPRDGHGLPA